MAIILCSLEVSFILVISRNEAKLVTFYSLRTVKKKK